MKSRKAAASPFADVVSMAVVGVVDGQPVYQCPTTGGLFFDRDSLSTSDYEDYYPYLRDFDASRFEWELGIRRSRYQAQLQLMGLLVNGRNSADIGAGPGYFVRVALEEGWTATGVEISTDAVARGQEHFGVRYASLDEIRDESLDAITCHHVLEHVAWPRPLLAAIRTKLKPGGLLVVHVPHQQPLSLLLKHRILTTLRMRSDLACSLYENIHVSAWTMQSLSALVVAAGFDVKRLTTAHMWSRFYDPFFLRSYIRRRDWVGMARKTARGAVDIAGIPFGRGDWVIGYFAKAGTASPAQRPATGRPDSA